MLKSEVVIGESYMVKVSRKWCVVKILNSCRSGEWVGYNFDTGRKVRIRTVDRLDRLAGVRS